jgi:hypothetical protein
VPFTFTTVLKLGTCVELALTTKNLLKGLNGFMRNLQWNLKTNIEFFSIQVILMVQFLLLVVSNGLKKSVGISNNHGKISYLKTKLLDTSKSEITNSLL